ncbi:hypothetical protein [Dysgonomonas sp. HGC4]|uniref:hypothetical protein n=1 Tax=Dysgonomonas sp. HGC4 TaxID=1658009 RepID=UPI0006821A37|nr:hypothetical protein [Dysgonomonas sp. HGC4]MBD8347083.1 hypothetical protein [Dysgonomonas sp. HGC4]
MKTKRLNKIVALLFCIAVIPSNIWSQSVGINTVSPRATFEVKGKGNTAAQKTLRVVNSSGTEILTMLDNGRLGVGQVAPSVRLDLRGGGANPIVAIGTTTNTASSVGGGAIRYMSGTKEIHYSDGTQWFRLQSSALRPCVVAPNNYVAGSYPSNVTTRLTGFVPSYDSHGAFNTSNSVYKAPVDGLYVVSFTLSFNRAIAIQANKYVEGRWVASNGRTVRCIQAYPDTGMGQGGITCSGTIQLAAGDTLWPEVWHNLGGTKSMRVYGYSPSSPNSDTGFNQLSIFAQ